MNKTEKLSPDDQTKADEKQLKKLLESYTAVAAHKLGRPPTLEDLTKMMTDSEEVNANPAQTPIASKDPGMRSIDKTSETTPEQAPQEMDKAEQTGPKILHMKVYYGMSGKDASRKPDPSNILYYESQDGKCYDCNAQAWSDTKPLLTDHLPSRPIQFNEKDIVAAIAHGVMDDDDFDTLDKAEMIEATPRRLWELTKKLKGLHEDLQKSEEMGEVDTDSDLQVDSDLLSGDHTEGSGVDLVADYMNTAGVEPSGEDMGPAEVGEDLIKQIMEAAVSAVSEEMSEQIRRVVREELANYGIGQAYDPSEENDLTEYDEYSNVE